MSLPRISFWVVDGGIGVVDVRFQFGCLPVALLVAVTIPPFSVFSFFSTASKYDAM